MPNPIIDVAIRQKQELIQRQENLTQRLGNVYANIYHNLEPAIEDLNNQILQATQNGTLELNQSKLFRLTRYQSLQKQIVEQLQRYGSYADLEVMSSIPDLITLGNNHSFILVRDQFSSVQGQKAITASWDKLNIDQIETALSFLSNDSPFHSNLTSNLGEGIATRIEDALIESIVLGKNPRITASVIRRELGLGLAWSLNSARTAQIYSYRTATSLNYRNNSDIVGSWTWLSARDNRTCSSCIAKHGSVFPLEQILNDHHQGRCTAIPNIRNAEKYGIEPTILEDGETWFNQQNEQTQLDIMGQSKLDAYRNNRFSFADLSRDYENDIYGTMVRESTLGELLSGRN